MAKSIDICTSSGKLRLIHFQSQKPCNKKILCIHGYCCDARIFTYMGEELSKRGTDVYSLDLFGHGQSDGTRGDLDFDKMMKAMDEVIAQIRDDGLPVILLGHSLGCTYALWYAHTYGKNIDGVILMAAYVRIPGMTYAGEALPSISKFLWFYFARYITPNKRVPATKVVRKSVLNSDEVRYMLADPNINYNYSYKYLIDVLANKNKDIQTLADIHVPILVLHGKKDRNVLPIISEKFYDLLKSKNKSIQLLDCDHWFYHAVFYSQDDKKYGEHDRIGVITFILNWVETFTTLAHKE